jgi:hypothetical protein
MNPKAIEKLGRKAIPLFQAHEIVQALSKEVGMTKAERGLLESSVESMAKIQLPGHPVMVASLDLMSFINNLQKAIKDNDASFLWQQRGICVKRVVDVEEFIESKEYMGQKGYLRPAIKKEILRLFDNDNYIEAVLTGAIGIGKNYFADLALAYMLYRLSVFHNPQLEFDLAPGSSIVFIMQSLTLTLARKVAFGQFADRLRLSPYFQKHFPYDHQITSELRFPKGIFVSPIGGSDTGAIGMNVFGGVIDEMNFMAQTADSAYARPDEEIFDQAERLYSSLIRRMESRFMQKGKLPGILILISSVNYPGDFTDRKVVESKTNPHIFVMKMAAWEALPADRFDGEKFLVEVGSDLKQSRLLNSMEEALDEADVIEVPVEYRTVFERDIDMALREVGGITTCSSHPFIPYRSQIQAAQVQFSERSGGIQLFKYESCVISHVVDALAPDWEQLVNMDYLENVIFDPTQAFAGHIDVGVTQDAAGVAIGRIIGDKMLPSTQFFDEKTKQFKEVRDLRVPFYQLDGLLQVKPPPGGEVDLELLRDLMLFLRGRIYLKWMTMDSYQSTMLIQAFRKMRIRSGVLSVDTSIAPYAELKQSIKDERILFAPHEVAARELREVEKDRKKDKIDHPEKGSKDVSDAMAGVVYMLQHKEAKYGRAVQRPTRISDLNDPAVRRIRIGKAGRPHRNVI